MAHAARAIGLGLGQRLHYNHVDGWIRPRLTFVTK